MKNARSSNQKSHTSRRFAGGSAIAGFFSLVGASCCVLPIVLVNLGVSTAIVSNLAFFARAQQWFQGLTVVLIAAGLVFAFRRGAPRPGVFIVLALATFFAVSAYLLPSYEREILTWLQQR